MTRVEFLGIETWEELLDFARENELWDEIDGYFLGRRKVDEYIEEQLPQFVREHDWYAVLAVLSEIPVLEADTCYRESGWLEFYEADDEDFQSVKNEILDNFEDWDDEYDDEPDGFVFDEDWDVEDEESYEEEETSVDEPFTLTELFTACNSGLKHMSVISHEENEEIEAAIADFKLKTGESEI